MTSLYQTMAFYIIITLSTLFGVKSKKVQLLLSSILPVVLLPFWIKQNPGIDVFIWIKAYSVFASLALIALTSHLKQKHAHRLLSLFLGWNILEAVIRNTQNGYMQNAIVGVLLLVPLLLSWWEKGTKTKRATLEYGLTPLWIGAYTVWNTVFILTEFPKGLFSLAITLLLPLATISKATHWLQWRAIAFTLYFLIRLSVPEWYYKMNASVSYTHMIPYLTLTGLVLAILMLTEQFIRPHFSQQPRVTPHQTS